MSNRITRQHVDAVAEAVSNLMGLPHDSLETSGRLCASCQRRGVDRASTLWKGCRVMAQGAYGGTSIRLVHADTGESELGLGYVSLRECSTFLQGMRAALLEIRPY